MLKKMHMSVLAGTAVLAMSFAAVSAEQEATLKLNDSAKRLSYSLGYQIGGDFKEQGVDMDADAVVKGIEDAMAGAEPLMPRKAMYETLSSLKRKVVNDDRKKLKSMNRREQELKRIAEGRKFLEENAGKPGVKTTASGLQYKIVKPGNDKKPGPKDTVTVNYRGMQVNGNEFDSSEKHGGPATFGLNNVIAGWTEGLQLIGEGGKIELYIPHTLAYRGTGPMAHKTLIFDVGLISVDGNGQERAQAQKK
jgi:FKBP-type peptidyl-prolyl cis-trans isomerase FklB